VKLGLVLIITCQSKQKWSWLLYSNILIFSANWLFIRKLIRSFKLITVVNMDIFTVYLKCQLATVMILEYILQFKYLCLVCMKFMINSLVTKTEGSIPVTQRLPIDPVHPCPHYNTCFPNICFIIGTIPSWSLVIWPLITECCISYFLQIWPLIALPSMYIHLQKNCFQLTEKLWLRLGIHRL
jgi:hypothetical protein